MAIKILTTPAVEPVSLAEAKNWLRIDHLDDDALLGDMIVAARKVCEQATTRGFITQLIEQTSSRSGNPCTMDLLIRPVQALQQVWKIDPEGIQSLIPVENYWLDSAHNRLILKPSATAALSGGYVKINYTAGYGDDANDVPEPLKLAILRVLAFQFENREQESRPYLPPHAQSLLAPYAAVRL